LATVPLGAVELALTVMLAGAIKVWSLLGGRFGCHIKFTQNLPPQPKQKMNPQDESLALFCSNISVKMDQGVVVTLREGRPL